MARAQKKWMTTRLNPDVCSLIKGIGHPLHAEIAALRKIILDADPEITENIKWNSPNYAFRHQDRITMRLQPAKHLQLIFHRGAKVSKQPSGRLIEDPTKLLAWKENDRAVATFVDMGEIAGSASSLTDIIRRWVRATAPAGTV